LEKTSLYYFHDCPENVLYKQPNLTEPSMLTEVVSEHSKYSTILIVSDAGAARGHYDKRRIADTEAFLKILNAFTYLYAWINPLPPDKWIATTAEDIAHIVPMFPLTREGLIDAFTILQGHPFTLGIDVDG